MDANKFQEECIRTGTNNPLAPTERYRKLNFALGLAGEAGETADLIKKVIFHGRDYDRKKLLLELGDVAWYLAMLAHEYGFTLHEIMEANVAKLRARYSVGFNIEEANVRKDEVSGGDKL